MLNFPGLLSSLFVSTLSFCLYLIFRYCSLFPEDGLVFYLFSLRHFGLMLSHLERLFRIHSFTGLIVKLFSNIFLYLNILLNSWKTFFSLFSRFFVFVQNEMITAFDQLIGIFFLIIYFLYS